MRINWKRNSAFVLLAFFTVSFGMWSLLTAAQTPPVDLNKNIAIARQKLTETPTESLPKEELADRVTTILKAKRDALKMRYECYLTFERVGTRENPNVSSIVELASFNKAREEYFLAELELISNPLDRVKLLRENLRDATEFESKVEYLRNFGVGSSPMSAATASAARFDAELLLARELIAQQSAKSTNVGNDTGCQVAPVDSCRFNTLPPIRGWRARRP